MRISFLFLFCLMAGHIHAQARLNKISINPIQLIGYNQLNLEYERGFNEGKFGIAIFLSQTGNASRTIHHQLSSLSNQSVAVKFYLKEIDKGSFWYGAMISVASGNIYDTNGIDKATNIGALGIQAVTGYQFIVKSFYITPFLSVGYAVTNDLFGSAEYTGDIGKPTDWLLTYGFKAGFCF